MLSVDWCYELNVSPYNAQIEAVTPNVMLLGDVAFGG